MKSNQNNPFTHSVRVYWEDTDGGGIVYYANYLKFAERARTEWLRAAGFDQSKLQAEFGILFVVRDCQIRYKNPAKLDDLLNVTVAVVEISSHKIILMQRVSAGGKTCAELRVELVVVDAETGKLAEIPSGVRAALD
jgi:acyl-CoA thioester hydrolase